MEQVATLNTNPDLCSMARVAHRGFSLDMATLHDTSLADMQVALAPFHNTLACLNISLSPNDTVQHTSCLTHYHSYNFKNAGTRNTRIGSHLIFRGHVRDAELLHPINEALRGIVDDSAVILSSS